jgi:hypothetical protein
MAILDEAHQLKNSKTEVGVTGRLWESCVLAVHAVQGACCRMHFCRGGQCARDCIARPASHNAASCPAPPPCLCPQTYRVASCLPTRLRFGLTGTPFQNDYTGGWVGGWAGAMPLYSCYLQLPCLPVSYSAPSVDAVPLLRMLRMLSSLQRSGT